MKVSPLAPKSFPELPPVGGVQLAALAAGLRYEKRADLMLAVVPEWTTVAGALTTSRCASAPVEWCRELLPAGTGRAILCNAGNANAFTGRAGEAAARATAATVGELLGVEAAEVFLASTGVIGEQLPVQALTSSIPALVEALKPADATGWEAVAGAIRTTDTFSKGASAPVEGTDAVVVGIAKGSGMIAPDMATMLAFVFTDLEAEPYRLQEITSAAVEASFNLITVDSDTSTSDTVLAFATAQSGVNAADHVDAVTAAFQSVMRELAHQIVRDGEGATKFVEVTVTGADEDDAAKRIALTIANSPLVKTALAAEDANWGRIVMAVGKAGEAADRDRLSIWIGDELVAEHGVQADGYSEKRATRHLRRDEVTIRVDVGVGDGVATVWTCDLTHGYIEINAGYRT